MGFSSEAGGPAERLFVMHEDGNGVNPSQLGWIDTRTFKLNIVGTTAPPLGRSELTGTGDGRGRCARAQEAVLHLPTMVSA